MFGKLSHGLIFAKHRRHAAFQEQDGEAKIGKPHGKLPGFALFRRSLVVRRACLENFLAGEFLQSIGATQRFTSQGGEAKTSKNHGKFLDSHCFVGTSLFEGRVWKTFSRENFCKA